MDGHQSEYANFIKDGHFSEDANFSENAHGRSWMVILVRTIIDGHFSEDDHGWSFK